MFLYPITYIAATEKCSVISIFFKIRQNLYHADEKYQHIIMMEKMNIINIKMKNVILAILLQRISSQVQKQDFINRVLNCAFKCRVYSQKLETVYFNRRNSKLLVRSSKMVLILRRLKAPERPLPTFSEG